MDKFIVTTSGVALIAFIFWFFFMKKSLPAPTTPRSPRSQGNDQ